jgi:hypothetical protein
MHTLARATLHDVRLEMRTERADADLASSPMLDVQELHTPILKPASFSLAMGECIALRSIVGSGPAAAAGRQRRSLAFEEEDP